jgi:hypothetical protein
VAVLEAKLSVLGQGKDRQPYSLSLLAGSMRNRGSPPRLSMRSSGSNSSAKIEAEPARDRSREVGSSAARKRTPPLSIVETPATTVALLPVRHKGSKGGAPKDSQRGVGMLYEK